MRGWSTGCQEGDGSGGDLDKTGLIGAAHHDGVGKTIHGGGPPRVNGVRERLGYQGRDASAGDREDLITSFTAQTSPAWRGAR